MRLQLRMAIVDKCSRTGDAAICRAAARGGGQAAPSDRPAAEAFEASASVPCSHISAAHGLAPIIALGGFVGWTWWGLLLRARRPTPGCASRRAHPTGLAACGVGVGGGGKPARRRARLVPMRSSARAISTLIDCSHGAAGRWRATTSAGGKRTHLSAARPAAALPRRLRHLHALWPVVVC